MSVKDSCELENFEIEFEVKDPKLISVNDQYMHPVRKCKDGRYRSYFCPSKSLKEFQAFYKEVLSKEISDDDIKRLSEFVSKVPESGLELIIEIGFPRNEIYDHDVSNFIKAIEDSITSRTKVDDSKNIRVVSEKKISTDDRIYLRVRIRTCMFDTYHESW